MQGGGAQQVLQTPRPRRSTLLTPLLRPCRGRFSETPVTLLSSSCSLPVWAPCAIWTGPDEMMDLLLGGSREGTWNNTWRRKRERIPVMPPSYRTYWPPPATWGMSIVMKLQAGRAHCSSIWSGPSPGFPLCNLEKTEEGNGLLFTCRPHASF